ncbi:TPA: prolipoprotein diacylglyceryl transferase [Candidatus Woesearchaeota archaeon]|nr:Prolipoprotein diacylglyceryl transferase [archaeon GW2011_AR15]MBS3104482.1 prolipoprotein diacylglyceryl transferase [Candidatus Woesearchaeota archaeon]HIH41204.1 prolipoprotein diacylglyceryl transferase [Candidatus Woesearchaeota archaeon]
MFINNINPDLVSVGPFSIRFYGIVYALGFILLTYILSKNAHKIKNLNKDKAVDVIIYMLVFGLIGARLVHVITDFPLYANNLLGVFAIWNGGLAFHGGILGGVLAVYFYCKKHKVSMMHILDTLSVPFPLILVFGRIANFMNSEHIGTATNLPWCVVYQKIDDVCRHPAQLYESFSMLVLFGMMLYLNRRKRKHGFLIWSFIAGYSILRLITEFFRAPLYVDVLGLSLVQLLSISLLGLSIYQLYKLKK